MTKLLKELKSEEMRNIFILIHNTKKFQIITAIKLGYSELGYKENSVLITN